MNKIFSILLLLIGTQVQAQGLLDSFYQDFLKYGTVYGAGDISNSIEASETYIFF